MVLEKAEVVDLVDGPLAHVLACNCSAMFHSKLVSGWHVLTGRVHPGEIGQIAEYLAGVAVRAVVHHPIRVPGGHDFQEHGCRVAPIQSFIIG